MAAHRYWRINATASDHGHIGFAEVELRAVANGPHAGSGIASASSIFDATYAAAKARDEDPATWWVSAQPASVATPQWWQFTFDVAVDVAEVFVRARSDANYTQAPRDFTVEWSDNGTAWTVAQRCAGYSWTSGQARAFAVSGPDVARYWRILLGPNTHFVLADIEMRQFVGGPDLTALPSTVPTSRTQWDSGTGPTKAIDAVANTIYASARETAGQYEWLQIAFQYPQRLAEIEIQARHDGTPGSTPPGAQPFTIQSSLDGTTWRDHNTVPGGYVYAIAERKTFPVAEPSYTYDLTAEDEATATGEVTDFAQDIDLGTLEEEATGTAVGNLIITRPPPSPKLDTSRLPIDEHLLGYWGFDEANEGDLAVDESSYARDLTVYGASGVVPARLGNGRQFDGATTYAELTNDTLNGDFRSFLTGTIVAWIILNTVNQAGDKLRPIICCDGPDPLNPDDARTIGLFVDVDGALMFTYDSVNPEAGIETPKPVVLKTAPGLIKINRYYSIALVLDQTAGEIVEGSGDDVEPARTTTLLVNNSPTAWATCTLDGVPLDMATQPLPPPASGGPTATFKVGASNRSESKWHGVIDELSIHSTPRSVEPYLRAAYFRLTLNATFQRLTAHENVRTIGTAEMGGGSRWWCYERDGSIYVIRENSLGLFTPEILLTTQGATGQGAPSPGGVEHPRLAYDFANDTLVIAFVSAGKVYKITATSQDVPSTQNVPATADTAGIIKMQDGRENFRHVISEEDEPWLDRLWDGSGNPAGTFLSDPVWGVAVTSALPAGWAWAVFRGPTGSESLYAILRTPQTVRDYAGLYYWLPVPDRVYGLRYTIAAIDDRGRFRKARGVVGIDYGSQMYVTAEVANLRYDMDQIHEPVRGRGAIGEHPGHEPFRFTFVNRTPVKQQLRDDPSFAAPRMIGDTPLLRDFFFTLTERTPVKFALGDNDPRNRYTGAGNAAPTIFATIAGRTVLIA